MFTRIKLEQQEIVAQRLVTFRAAERGDDLADGAPAACCHDKWPGRSDFMECIELVCSGNLEKVEARGNKVLI